jgi:hypothetical protein
MAEVRPVEAAETLETPEDSVSAADEADRCVAVASSAAVESEFSDALCDRLFVPFTSVLMAS